MPPLRRAGAATPDEAAELDEAAAATTPVAAAAGATLPTQVGNATTPTTLTPGGPTCQMPASRVA